MYFHYFDTKFVQQNVVLNMKNLPAKLLLLLYKLNTMSYVNNIKVIIY